MLTEIAAAPVNVKQYTVTSAGEVAVVHDGSAILGEVSYVGRPVTIVTAPENTLVVGTPDEVKVLADATPARAGFVVMGDGVVPDVTGTYRYMGIFNTKPAYRRGTDPCWLLFNVGAHGYCFAQSTATVMTPFFFKPNDTNPIGAYILTGVSKGVPMAKAL